MSVQSFEPVDWSQFTFTRVRILGGLADLRSEREIAELMGLSYHTIRGHVEDLEALTGETDVRGLGRWWRRHAIPTFEKGFQ